MTVQQITIKVELFFDGMWNDITGDVRGQPSDGFGIQIQRGRRNEDQDVNPTSISLTVNNCNGRYTPTNPNSDLFGKIGRNTPLRVSVNGQIRATGEVSEWPLNWDQFGKDVWVPIQASGILRRLGQGDRPLLSALRRAITFNATTGNLVGYWPVEGYEGAEQVAAVVGRRGQAVFGGEVPIGSRENTPAGSITLPEIPVTAEVGEGFEIRVPVDGIGISDPFILSFIYASDTAGWNAGFMSLSGGPAPRILFDIFEGEVAITGRDEDGGFVFNGSVFDPDDTLTNGDFRWIEFRVSESANIVTYETRVLNISGDEIIPLSTLATVATTNNESGSLKKVTIENSSAISGPVSFGHIAVWQTTSSTALDNSTVAIDGHFNEMAGNRIARLCNEEDIAFVSVGDLNSTTLMGPQRPRTFLDLIRECEEADLGLLYEPKDQLGLAYRTRRSLYNQEPTLQLDYESCHLRHPLRATYDDQFIRNDVTVSRTGGSSARVVLEAGPLSVQDPPDGVGLYDEQVTVNVASDLQLPSQAGWRLHLGTIDEARYPVVRIRNLAPPSCPLDPDLASASSALGLGDKLSIINPPVWVPPNTIEQLVQGYDEELDKYKWLISFNTTPASPFTVAVRAETEDPVVVPTNLTNDSSTANPATTASVSPTDNALLLLAIVVVKEAAPAPESDDVSVSGLDLTWELVESRDYRARRRLYLFRSQGVATPGTITITYSGDPTYQEMQWALSEWVDAVVGSNGASAIKGVATAVEETSVNSLTVNIGSSPTSGDRTYVAFGVEEAGGPPTLEAGWSTLSALESANVRHLVTADDFDQDQTPTISWSSSGNGAGGIGLIVSATPGAAAPGPANPVRRDTAGSVLDSAFVAGTDTSFDVETTLGPLWGQTGQTNMDFPFDVNISGAQVRVTGISAPVGQVQTFTCELAIVNNVNKTIPAGTDVRLWQSANRGL